MSLDEQIAHLEARKRTTLEDYDRQIHTLWQEKQQAEDLDTDSVLPSGRHLIRSQGRTLSQVILEDRGSY